MRHRRCRIVSDGDEPAGSAVESALSTDRALSLLSDARRRQLLIVLLDRKPDAEIGVDSETLKRVLCRAPGGQPLSGDTAYRIIISMHHNHLPRLVESDVIEWNEWEDTVEPGPAFDVIEPFIEHLDRNREALPEDWRGIPGVDDE